jgi:3-deoxy-D-manno-octulosonic-acid transferase
MKIWQKLLSILWALQYLPLGWLVSILTKWGRNRAKFERQNLTDPHSRPFKAQIAFEVSSEGELEQVYPLLEYFLVKEIRVELIYSSESVEQKCQKLGQKYPNHLRIFRLPLLTHFFFNFLGGQSLKSWMSAPILILCRYDFYPQLLSLDVKFGLVSASLKGKKKAKQRLYNLFDFIICATPQDQKKFKEFYSGNLSVQDFRVLRIGDRLKKANILSYLELFKETPVNRRLILGSCWPIEMEVFSHSNLQKDILEKKIQVAIAPHSLKDRSIKEIVESFKRNTSNKIPLYELNESVDASTLKGKPGVILITSKGTLCELYSIFGQSYVGGGFGRSIHSVLEPYLAGSRVYCGPKTFRSTEYDFVHSHSPEYIHVVRKLGEFYNSYVDEPINSDEISLREKIILESNKDFKRIISLLAGKMNE